MLLWLKFNQADLCPYTPLRISKPNESTIGRYRYKVEYVRDLMLVIHSKIILIFGVPKISFKKFFSISYLFDSVPPQPNCPPIGVPLARLVTQFIVSGVTLLPKPHADAHGFKQLPLTLYTTNRITATDYSKVSRGLRFPLEIPGLYTRKEFSGDTSSGQWRSRYTIHASRHSTGKVLRSKFVTYSFLRIGPDISADLTTSLLCSDCIFELLVRLAFSL